MHGVFIKRVIDQGLFLLLRYSFEEGKLLAIGGCPLLYPTIGRLFAKDAQAPVVWLNGTWICYSASWS